MFCIVKNHSIELPDELYKELELKEGDKLECKINVGSITLDLVRDEPVLLEMRCFGILKLYINSEPLHFSNKKGKELLVLLAVEQGVLINKTRVAERLWPDALGEKSMNNYYKVYSYIKNFFKKCECPCPIISSNSVIGLNMKYVRCDFMTFEKLYMRKEHIEDLLIAYNLYSAPLLDSEDYEWKEIPQAHFEIHYIQLLENICNYYLDKDIHQFQFYKKQLMEYTG